LARSLELGADVGDNVGEDGAPMAERLRAAAGMIRERGTFLED
jgi:hypothetical protein